MSDFLDEIRNDHSEFDKGKLEFVFGGNPFEIFQNWLKNAVISNQLESNAFSLSTVDSAGQPSSRILYLKELVDESFVFYTNYLSEKGTDLAQNECASMLFFWPSLQQQIRIEGRCHMVSAEMSDAYFRSRPRGSKLGAWASHQSDRLESREELEKRVEQLQKLYPKEVPRPAHWGGYALIPEKMEFWQGRSSRLHDRIVFEKIEGQWKIYRLNP